MVYFETYLPAFFFVPLTTPEWAPAHRSDAAPGRAHAGMEIADR